MVVSGGNGWNEYEKLVLATLANQTSEISKLRTELHEFKERTVIDLTRLKTLSGVAGGLVGMVAAVVTTVVGWFITKGS